MRLQEWMKRVEAVGPRLAEGVQARDASDEFVHGHHDILREGAFLSMLVPTELAGPGASHSTACRVVQRLARYDASTALALSMHQHLVAAQVFAHRAGQSRPAALLRRVAEEQIVLLSTGARDWLESSGRLQPVPGGYRLTAKKPFASGAPVADVAVTSARLERPGPRVLHFAVPLKGPGVRWEDDWKAHGMRGTGSHTLVFEDVFVPEDAISLDRPAGELHPVWLVVLAVALPLIASVYVGIAQRAAEVARGWARRRDSDTAAWAIGEMDSARFKAEALLDAMVGVANDLDFAPQLDRANRMLALKTATVEAAQACVERAVEATGGPAYFRKNELERLLRDVRAGHFHPLPRPAQTLFTGRVGMGWPPVEPSAGSDRQAGAAAESGAGAGLTHVDK